MTQKNIKAIIIDDEALARQIISRFLENWPQVQIVDECNDGFEAFKSIQEHKPDLIFLDIQMPRVNGFELLEILDNPPHIIFSTAHDEYALKAFEKNAVDYLLKPYTTSRFGQAMEKVLEKIEGGIPQQTIAVEENQQAQEFLNRIVVKDGAHVEIIPVNDILFLEAADDYVMINTHKERFIKQSTLKFYENNLFPEQFVRVHRSFIIALEAINRIEPYSKDNFQVILKNGDTVPASRSGYKKLRELLKF